MTNVVKETCYFLFGHPWEMIAWALVYSVPLAEFLPDKKKKKKMDSSTTFFFFDDLSRFILTSFSFYLFCISPSMTKKLKTGPNRATIQKWPGIIIGFVFNPQNPVWFKMNKENIYSLLSFYFIFFFRLIHFFSFFKKKERKKEKREFYFLYIFNGYEFLKFLFSFWSFGCRTDALVDGHLLM